MKALQNRPRRAVVGERKGKQGGRKDFEKTGGHITEAPFMRRHIVDMSKNYATTFLMFSETR
jgi:hypothetical protein